jgi:hypothetical protein
MHNEQYSKREKN